MSDPNNNTTMRLDKWLWCSRFFKTRSQATEAIKSGKIKINDVKAKPSKLISINDRLSIRKGPWHYSVVVQKVAKNRLSASLAAELYIEDKDSIAKRNELSTLLKAESKLYPKTSGRPTKRDRRQIIRFKTEGNK